MAKDIPMLVHLDMGGNQIKTMVVEKLTSAPSSPIAGQMYYDTDVSKLFYYNGTEWIDLTSANSVAVASDDTSENILSVSYADGEYTITVSPAGINHSEITDDEAEKHRQINDSGSTETDLFSAEKILSLFEQAESAAEWQDSALSYISDNTSAPPTEVEGDRYVLAFDGGTPHTDWDDADAGDIVEFDGTNWIATTPSTGTFISVDDDTSGVYLCTGSAWILQQWENTPDATETTKGKLEIATSTEVMDATDHSRAVTPKTLDEKIVMQPAPQSLIGSITWEADGDHFKYEVSLPMTHPIADHVRNEGVMAEAFINNSGTLEAIGVQVEMTKDGTTGSVTAVTFYSNTDVTDCEYQINYLAIPAEAAEQ